MMSVDSRLEDGEGIRSCLAAPRIRHLDCWRMKRETEDRHQKTLKRTTERIILSAQTRSLSSKPKIEIYTDLSADGP